jgi:hypothetical protein
MMPKIIKTLENKDLGLEAVIADGNAKFNYRVICKDTDADIVFTTIFCHNYFKAKEKADIFLGYLVPEEAA